MFGLKFKITTYSGVNTLKWLRGKYRLVNEKPDMKVLGFFFVNRMLLLRKVGGMSAIDLISFIFIKKQTGLRCFIVIIFQFLLVWI